MEGHAGSVWVVRAALDGEKVCSSSFDKTVRLWDVSTGIKLKCFTGHTKSVWLVDMTLDGSVIVLRSYDNTIRMWNVASVECTHTLEGHTNIVCAVCLSADEKSIFSGSNNSSQDKTVKMWDINTGELV